MLPWFRNLMRQPQNSVTSTIIILFLAWKLLLLTVAFLTPGPSYDSSTELLFQSQGLSGTRQLNVTDESWDLARLARRLTRWDAIYFTDIGQRGRVFEQEWAFGWGWTQLLAELNQRWVISSNEPLNVACIGILISNACHLLSALVLSQLAKSLAPPPFRQEIGFISAALHVLSPAGLFLTAPYAESLFSLLSFLGYIFYFFSCEQPGTSRDYRNDARLLASGVFFGLATTVRSNGVLAGLIFAFDVLADLAVLARRYPRVSRYGIYAMPLGVLFLFIAWTTGLCRQELLGRILEYWPIFAIAFANAALYFVLQPGLGKYDTKSLNGHIRKMVISTLSGAYVAVGLIFPQYLAYKEYCTNEDVGKTREWCSAFPPSVYSWVQSHYWNVGLFKYWVPSNIPLFILAAPTLALFLVSARAALLDNFSRIFGLPSAGVDDNLTPKQKADVAFKDSICYRFAFPQLALAGLALTTFHVQIVTRLSSGYPLWYLFTASLIYKARKDKGIGRKQPIWSTLIVRWMVMYALIQGVLFAGFLPPA